MKGTWQTTDDGGGGSGVGMAMLAFLAVMLLGPAVAAAVAELLHVVLIVAVVLAILAAGGLAAFVAWRLRHRRQNAPWQVQHITPAPPRPSPLPSEPRQAIEPPRQLHLHFHGVSAEDVAAVLERHRQDG